MDSTWMVGGVFIALGTIGGLFLTVGKPIITLNKTLTEIQADIKAIRGDLTRNETRITKHGQEIENVSKIVDLNTYKIGQLEDKTNDHEQRIHYLEARKGEE